MATQGISVRLSSPGADMPGDGAMACRDTDILAACAVLLARYTGEPETNLSWQLPDGTARPVNVAIHPAATWSRLATTLERALLDSTAGCPDDLSVWQLSFHVDAFGTNWLTLQGNAGAGLELAGVRGHLGNLLDTSRRLPDLPISSVPTLTGPELADIERWNATAREWPPGPRRLDEPRWVRQRQERPRHPHAFALQPCRRLAARRAGWRIEGQVHAVDPAAALVGLQLEPGVGVVVGSPGGHGAARARRQLRQ